MLLESYYFTQNFALRNLIFTKKIPKKVRLKKGLRIKGEFFTSGEVIYYEVKRHTKAKEVVNKSVIKPDIKKFDFVIPFKEAGLYTIFIYTNEKGNKKNFSIANKFEIKVRKGLIFLI